MEYCFDYIDIQKLLIDTWHNSGFSGYRNGENTTVKFWPGHTFSDVGKKKIPVSRTFSATCLTFSDQPKTFTELFETFEDKYVKCFLIGRLGSACSIDIENTLNREHSKYWYPGSSYMYSVH